jgi:hypothetical protein
VVPSARPTAIVGASEPAGRFPGQHPWWRAPGSTSAVERQRTNREEGRKARCSPVAGTFVGIVIARRRRTMSRRNVTRAMSTARTGEIPTEMHCLRRGWLRDSVFRVNSLNSYENEGFGSGREAGTRADRLAASCRLLPVFAIYRH